MKGNKLVKNKLEIIKDGDKMKYAIIDWKNNSTKDNSGFFVIKERKKERKKLNMYMIEHEPTINKKGRNSQNFYHKFVRIFVTLGLKILRL